MKKAFLLPRMAICSTTTNCRTCSHGSKKTELMSIDLDNPKERLASAERGPEPDSPHLKEEKPAKKDNEDLAPPTAVPYDHKDVKLPSIRKAAEEDLEFFKQKPVITITKYQRLSRIKTASKNVFSSYRVFQIKTQPGDIVVHRCREDFRWLTEKLKEEYPNQQVIAIEKGQLSKNILEDYFDYLINKQGLNYSRSLKFFLCTDDIKFQARRERDDSYVKNLFNKIFNGPKINEHDLNLNESHKVFVASRDCSGCLRWKRATCTRTSTS